MSSLPISQLNAKFRAALSLVAGALPAGISSTVLGALGYVWDSTANSGSGGWVPIPGDATNGAKMQEQFAPKYEDNTNNCAWTHDIPLSGTTNQLLNGDSTALETSRVVKASAGKLYAVDGMHHTRSISDTLAAVAATPAQISQVSGGNVYITLSGTWAGTVVFEYYDGAAWQAFSVTPVGGGPAVTTSSANGSWSASSVEWHQIRVRCTVYTSGTINVTMGSNTLVLFLQFFNATALPADGSTTAIINIPVRVLEQVRELVHLSKFGRAFTTGICWCLSTTAGVKHLAVGQGGMFNVGYK